MNSDVLSDCGAGSRRNCRRDRRHPMHGSRRAFLLVFTLTGAVGAGGPQPFDIPWYTVDGGGGKSTGGPFTVSGTIGQPDAGMMSGGGFVLSGGYWSGASAAPVPGDCDGDGTIALPDHVCLAVCMHGPGQAPGPGCEELDLDGDRDVDIRDFRLFQALFGD